MLNSNHQTHNAGFSLLEMVLVITIIGMLAGLTAPVAVNYIEGSLGQRTRTALITEGNIAMAKMQQRIVNMDKNTDSSFSPNASSLSVPVGDQIYTFQMNGGNLEQTVDSTTSILSTHASSVDFDYYDQNGNTTSTNSDILYIEITLTLTDGDESFTLHRLIFLRNSAYGD